MSNIKYIFLSIIRNFKRSIFFLLAIIILATFIGISYLIGNNVNQLNLVIKSKIDTYAVIQYTEDYYLENKHSMSQMEYIEFSDKLYDIWNTLSKNEFVLSSNINLSNQGYGEFVSNLNHKNWKIVDHEKLKGSILLSGITNNSLQEQQSIIEIVEGRSITKEDIDKKNNVIILHENYTYSNGLKINIGDIINIKYQNYEEI